MHKSHEYKMNTNEKCITSSVQNLLEWIMLGDNHFFFSLCFPLAVDPLKRDLSASWVDSESNLTDWAPLVIIIPCFGVCDLSPLSH